MKNHRVKAIDLFHVINVERIGSVARTQRPYHAGITRCSECHSASEQSHHIHIGIALADIQSCSHGSSSITDREIVSLPLLRARHHANHHDLQKNDTLTSEKTSLTSFPINRCVVSCGMTASWTCLIVMGIIVFSAGFYSIRQFTQRKTEFKLCRSSSPFFG